MAFKGKLRSVWRKVHNGREERKVLYDVDPIPYSRLLLLERIRNLIESGRNVLIVGEKGSGKSFLIRRLSKEVISFPSLKRILSKISRGKTISELVDNLNSGIVFIDDIDYLNRKGFRVIEEISKKVIIVATSRKELRKDIFKIVRIERLSEFEAYSIARRYLIDDNEEIWEEIAMKSEGNIGRLIHLCNFPKDRGFIRRRELIPPKYLPIIAFLFLVLKYHYYFHSIYQVGYLFGMFGWLMLIIYRIFKL